MFSRARKPYFRHHRNDRPCERTERLRVTSRGRTLLAKPKAKFALVFLTRSKAKQSKLCFLTFFSKSKAKQSKVEKQSKAKQTKVKKQSKANRKFWKNFQVPNLEFFGIWALWSVKPGIWIDMTEWSLLLLYGPQLGYFGYQKPKIFSNMAVMIEISTRSQAKQSKAKQSWIFKIWKQSKAKWNLQNLKAKQSKAKQSCADYPWKSKAKQSKAKKAK